MELDFDEKYIDSPLGQSSLVELSKLRNELTKYDKFDTVVVAPLRKSLQTCYELFKDEILKS